MVQGYGMLVVVLETMGKKLSGNEIVESEMLRLDRTLCCSSNVFT